MPPKQVQVASGATYALHLDFLKHVKKVTKKRKGDKLTITLVKLRPSISLWGEHLQRERKSSEPLDV